MRVRFRSLALLLIVTIVGCTAEETSSFSVVAKAGDEVRFDRVQVRLKQGDENALRTVGYDAKSFAAGVEIARFQTEINDGDTLFVITLDDGQLLSEQSHSLSPGQSSIEVQLDAGCTLASCQTACTKDNECMTNTSCGVAICENDVCKERLEDSRCENDGLCTPEGCQNIEPECGDGLVSQNAGEICDPAAEPRCSLSMKQCYACVACERTELVLQDDIPCMSERLGKRFDRVFDARGNMISQTYSNRDTVETVKSWRYDAKDREIEMREIDPRDPRSEKLTRTEYHVDGRIREREVIDIALDTRQSVENYSYDAMKRLTRRASSRAGFVVSETRITYGDNERTEIHREDTTDDLKVNQQITKTYSNEKLLREEHDRNNDGTPEEVHIYDYDARHGQVIRRTIEDGQNSRRLEYTYDMNDVLVKRELFYGDTRSVAVTYTYDENGYPATMREVQDSGRTTIDTVYVVDAHGRVVREDKSTPLGPVSFTNNYDCYYGLLD